MVLWYEEKCFKHHNHAEEQCRKSICLKNKLQHKLTQCCDAKSQFAILMLHKLHVILSKKKLQYLNFNINFKTWCEILCTTHVLATSCINQYFVTYIYKERDIDYSTGVKSGWLCSTCQSNFIFRGSASYTWEDKEKMADSRQRRNKTMKTIMISNSLSFWWWMW